MRFRDATLSDIPGITAAFTGFNALPLEPRVRSALPGLLAQLIASPACTVTVFEDDWGAGQAVVSVAGGLFLADAVVDRYLAAPHPGFLSSVLGSLLEGQRPLLTQEEIRRANSTDGLNLAVLSLPSGPVGFDDPRHAELRKAAPQAGVRCYGGYRLRAMYYEVFADPVAAYLQAGGYRLLHDYSAREGTGIFGPGCRPQMFRLTRADLPPGAMSMATQMFDPLPARLGLTPAEQRVALRALDGASDQAIAEALGLSSETVRSCWRSIYRRLGPELPQFDTRAMQGSGSTRGVEKRRIAIDYLRQNLHELRPVEAPAPGDAARRARRN
jgi:hypothetical protein